MSADTIRATWNTGDAVSLDRLAEQAMAHAAEAGRALGSWEFLAWARPDVDIDGEWWQYATPEQPAGHREPASVIGHRVKDALARDWLRITDVPGGAA